MPVETKLPATPWTAVPATERIHHFTKPVFGDGIWDVRCAEALKLPVVTVDRGDDHDEPTREGAEALAHLIAAAPDLLADAESTDQGYTWFIQQLREFYEFGDGKSQHEIDNFCQSLIAHLESRQIGTRAAIDKALTGGPR